MPLYTFVMYNLFTQKNNSIHFESRTVKSTLGNNNWYYQLKRFLYHSFHGCCCYSSYFKSKYH